MPIHREINMEILYSRYVDGSIPVYIHDNGLYEIRPPDKDPIICKTAKQLLTNLIGHPRNWSLDRYFGKGIYAPPEVQPISPIFELFESGDVILNAPYGIDLEQRGDEVAKLLFAGFHNWIFGCHYDPQDVLQEVYKGILIRNRGTCPFDADKASFGHYVHRVCQCVLSNYHRKQSKKNKIETTGIYSYQDGVWKETDVSDGSLEDSSCTVSEDNMIVDDLVKVLMDRPIRINRLAAKIVPLLGQGYNQGDIARQLKTSKLEVSRAMKVIQEYAEQCGYVL